MVSSNSTIDWTKFMSDDDKNEFVKTPEFREWLLGILSDANKSTNIVFKKKDGTIRNMKCTRNPSLIPEEQHAKTESARSSSALTVFDLEKNEWRSFIVENVIRIEYEF